MTYTPDSPEIRRGMMVLCDRGILRGIVDCADDQHIQITLNASGEQVWVPVSSIREVEDDVHLRWSNKELMDNAYLRRPLKS